VAEDADYVKAFVGDSAPGGPPDLSARSGTAVVAAAHSHGRKAWCTPTAVRLRGWPWMPALTLSLAKIHPCRSSRVFLIIEDSAQASVSPYIQVGDLVWVGCPWP